MEKLLQIYQTCTITLKASAVVRRAVLSATEYDESNMEKTVAEMKLVIMFTCESLQYLTSWMCVIVMIVFAAVIFTLEALVVAGAVRKIRREQQEPQYYIDVV